MMDAVNDVLQNLGLLEKENVFYKEFQRPGSTESFLPDFYLNPDIGV